jgi:outer membrane protein assembly factor BamD (BamD/ComL family)
MKSLFRKITIALLVVFTLCSSTLFIEGADAAAKAKKKGTAKSLPKEWAPYQPKLTLLLQKSQNKSFFTPQDGDTLDELRQVSDDFQERYAKVKDVAPILYQLGLLFTYREMWFEAFDAFSTINERFPQSPYTPKSKFQLLKMKKRLGEDYAVLEESRLPAEGDASSLTGGSKVVAPLKKP